MQSKDIMGSGFKFLPWRVILSIFCDKEDATWKSVRESLRPNNNLAESQIKEGSETPDQEIDVFEGFVFD